MRLSAATTLMEILQLRTAIALNSNYVSSNSYSL